MTSEALKRSKLNQTNKVKKERYLIKQDNTIYTFSIKLSFLSIEQDRSKVQTNTKVTYLNRKYHCAIIEKYNFIEYLYILLFCLVK